MSLQHATEMVDHIDPASLTARNVTTAVSHHFIKEAIAEPVKEVMTEYLKDADISALTIIDYMGLIITSFCQDVVNHSSPIFQF